MNKVSLWTGLKRKSTGQNVVKLGNSLKEIMRIYFLLEKKVQKLTSRGNGVVCNIVKRNKTWKHEFKMCLIVFETYYIACSMWYPLFS